MEYAYKYGHKPGKGWIGVIFEDTPPPRTVITAGVEDSEDAIIDWCEKSIESIKRGGEELPCRNQRLRN